MTERATAGTVEYWAQTKPESLAVVDGDTRLTWRNWNDRANVLAEQLHRGGIAAGDIVATRCGIRSEWLILASAIAKLDARIVGINWRLTPRECEQILRDCHAKAIFLDDPDPMLLSATIGKLGINMAVSIDTPSAGFTLFADLEAGSGPARFATHEAPIIIYTSGTTGAPRGAETRTPDPGEETVMAAYQQEVADLRQQRNGDVMFVTMPLHHAAGPWQIRFGIAYGSTIVLMRRFDAEKALELIQNWRVTHWNAVPTMFKRIASLPQTTLAQYDVSSVRNLVVGAAPTPHSLKLQMMELFGECLHESYGGTEFAIVSHLGPAEQKRKRGSAGRILKTVRVTIRNARGEDVAPGEIGEIWVWTPATIRQYLNEPPLGPDTLHEDGSFRTGDCGWVDAEGYLYVTDRAKDMIISGGVNIYPAEIETVMIQHPAIQDVAVIGIPDAEYGESVHAYCELAPGRTATAEQLREFCRDQLASYKIPRHVEFVDELPRSTVGKTLKRDLRNPHWKELERSV